MLLLGLACQASEPPSAEPPPQPTADAGPSEPPILEPRDASVLPTPTFRPDERLAAARALGAPQPLFVPSLVYTEDEIDRAVGGTAFVTGLPIELEVPFDWEQDPFDNRVYRLGLQAWWGIAPLLVGHATGQRPDGLPFAIALAVDWIETYRTPFEGQSEFAWNGPAASFRAAYLAYLFRAGAMDGVLGERDADVLWEGLERHGAFLEEGTMRFDASNIAITHDVGLGLLGLQIPFLPDAASYRATAAARIAPLANRLMGEEAILLEHTPWYHFLVLRDLERARRFTPGLESLFARGRDAGMWMLATDGHLVQFGDSHLVRPQPDVVGDATLPDGLAVFERTGFGVAREGESLLAVTAQFHSRVHKQRDDLTFAWFERGVRIVRDTGRYGYFPDEPGRAFALSTRAHSVLTVDDLELPLADEDVYGSALVGGDRAGDWYVLVADDPQLEGFGVTHRRYWFFAPGAWVVIVDDVAASGPRSFARYLHLGPELVTRAYGANHLAEGGGVRVWIHDASGGVTTVARGREDPSLLGFTYPSDRAIVARGTIVTRRELTEGLLVTALRLDPDASYLDAPPRITATKSAAGLTIEIDGVALTAAVDPTVRLTR